ncbi:MAG: pyruvate kinase [Bacteriovoracaceae bacterium]|nr:pyruvate kinase [Bacteriovoracaceae bacterium]
MRLTKIIATIGPASESPAQIKALLEAGVNTFRLNFSHGSLEEHQGRVQTIRQVAASLNRQVGILQDLCGPKIRLGDLVNGQLTLKVGEQIVLSGKPCQGTSQKVSVTYARLGEEVAPGEIIYIADGTVALEVLQQEAGDIVARVIDGGVIKSHQGVNLPQSKLSVAAVTEKDINDVKAGLKMGVDWVALSFVRQAQDVLGLRKIMEEEGIVVPIMAKLERPEALENLASILAAADAVMVARGDLAIETPMERIPIWQKEIIRQARQANKVVVVATQMLESMIHEERPTRAEVADVSNAVFDGADAVMLSGETAVGDHPALVVAQMAKIVMAAEKVAYVRGDNVLQAVPSDLSKAVAATAVRMAETLKAAAFVIPTDSGRSATLVARHRPGIPILALTHDLRTAAKLTLRFGVVTRLIEHTEDFEQVVALAQQEIKQSKLAQNGQFVILTAGHPFGEHGSTNLIKAMLVN